MNMQPEDTEAEAKEAAQNALFHALLAEASPEEVESAKAKARTALVKMFTFADAKQEEDITPEELEQAKLKAQDAVRNVLMGDAEYDRLEHVKDMARDALLTSLMPAIDAH